MLQPRNFPRPTKQQVDLKQQKDVDLLKAQTLRKEGPAAVANDVDLWCGPILPASSHVRPSFKITPRSFSTIIICESQKLQLTSFKLLRFTFWRDISFCALQVYYWSRSRGGGEARHCHSHLPITSTLSLIIAAWEKLGSTIEGRLISLVLTFLLLTICGNIHSSMIWFCIKKIIFLWTPIKLGQLLS